MSFVFATVLGEWLLTLQGYHSGGDVPLVPALVAAAPAMAILIAPALAAVWFGLRARRYGQRSGRIPAVIGMVAAVGLIVVNLAAFLVGR